MDSDLSSVIYKALISYSRTAWEGQLTPFRTGAACFQMASVRKYVAKGMRSRMERSSRSLQTKNRSVKAARYCQISLKNVKKPGFFLNPI
jgi:hypothetical protein